MLTFRYRFGHLIKNIYVSSGETICVDPNAFPLDWPVPPDLHETTKTCCRSFTKNRNQIDHLSRRHSDNGRDKRIESEKHKHGSQLVKLSGVCDQQRKICARTYPRDRFSRGSNKFGFNDLVSSIRKRSDPSKKNVDLF